MDHLMIRNLAAHKARLAMTLAAVAMGTAFVAGTLFFTASAERAELAVPQRTDVAVQVAGGGDGHLPEAAVDELARLPGVAQARPVVAGPGSVVGGDGKALAAAAGVTNWGAGARFALTAGRAPAGPAEVVLAEPAARAA